VEAAWRSESLVANHNAARRQTQKTSNWIRRNEVFSGYEPVKVVQFVSILYYIETSDDRFISHSSSYLIQG
jgi:hypothetical protein